MKIIINCDDLGISTKVNEAIFELMDQRRVTSATMMMNAPALEDAVARIGRYKNCSFGVHMNLTQFAPLTSHAGLRPLLNDNGEFSGNALVQQQVFRWTDELRHGVLAEFCAQIERALQLGVPVSHIDSHHHVHTRVGLLGVLQEVRKRFGIRRIRLRRNISGHVRPMGRARQAANHAWNLALQRLLHARTTDRFTAFSVFHEQLCAGVSLPGTIELMCHPGSARFAAETALLQGDWPQLMSRDAQLISYNELN